MRSSLSSGLALAMLLGIGVAACNDENAAVTPTDEPSQTGSIPAEPIVPLEDPAMTPSEEPALTPSEDPAFDAAPPAEEPAQ